MGDVVNLRRARKAKARDEKSREADANRLAFGRTRAERTATERDLNRAATLLDGHKIVSGVDPRLSDP